MKNWRYHNQNNCDGTKDNVFFLQNKRRLVKKLENLNKYSPFFIIFLLPVMLNFTAHFTSVHLFTCVAKAVTSRRSQDINLSKFLKIQTNKMACKPNRLRSACALVHADSKDSDQTMSIFRLIGVSAICSRICQFLSVLKAWILTSPLCFCSVLFCSVL